MPPRTRKRRTPAAAAPPDHNHSASPDAADEHIPLRPRRDRTPDPERHELVRSDNPRLHLDEHPDLRMLDYRIKSKDEQGIPARWSLQVPPSFDAEARRMVDQGRYFEDLGSMVRWSVFFAMDYLQRLIPPPFPSNVQVLKAMYANNAHFETRLQYMTSVERTAANAYEAIGRGMQSAAVKLISKQIEEIRKLPPGDEFREEILRLIKQRFGHLLKKGQLVRFDELEESE